MRRLIASLGLLSLGGCIVTEEMIDAHYAAATEPTASMRASSVTAIKILLMKPYSVQNAEISSVTTGDPAERRVVFCVRFDSTNRGSGTSGRGTVGLTMANDEMGGVYEDAEICDEPRLRWYDFPELEKIDGQAL